jgi:hypothetical protein
MAAVLFMVGRGHEQPDIVSKLLDVERHEAKPLYRMASDLPLVLHEAAYDGLEWQRNDEPGVVKSLRSTAKRLAFQLAIVDGFVTSLAQPNAARTDASGGGDDDDVAVSSSTATSSAAQHVPLLLRDTEAPFAAKIKRQAAKSAASDESKKRRTT